MPIRAIARHLEHVVVVALRRITAKIGLSDFGLGEVGDQRLDVIRAAITETERASRVA